MKIVVDVSLVGPCIWINFQALLINATEACHLILIAEAKECMRMRMMKTKIHRCYLMHHLALHISIRMKTVLKKPDTIPLFQPQSRKKARTERKRKSTGKTNRISILMILLAPLSRASPRQVAWYAPSIFSMYILIFSHITSIFQNNAVPNNNKYLKEHGSGISQGFSATQSKVLTYLLSENFSMHNLLLLFSEIFPLFAIFLCPSIYAKLCVHSGKICTEETFWIFEAIPWQDKLSKRDQVSPSILHFCNSSQGLINPSTLFVLWLKGGGSIGGKEVAIRSCKLCSVFIQRQRLGRKHWIM